MLSCLSIKKRYLGRKFVFSDIYLLIYIAKVEKMLRERLVV